MDTELERISQRIREKREGAGLTLQELARRSGVATSTIQKVETGQMMPSVAVVMKIARGLTCRVAELVDEAPVDELALVHLRAAERHVIGSPGKLRVERLSGDLTDPTFETWRVTLHPGVSSGRGSIRYEGEELVVCEKGTVTFKVGDDEYRLRPGDSLHFKAHLPHSWSNDGNTLASFSVTGTLPEQFRAAMHGRLTGARRASA